MHALDVGVEEPVGLAVQQCRHQSGLHHPTAIHQVFDGVSENAGRLARDGAREGSELELSLELRQRGIGEHEGGRRDLCLHGGVPKEAQQLHAFDRERRRERDGAASHERRADRAARDGRREDEHPVFQVECDDVAS